MRSLCFVISSVLALSCAPVIFAQGTAFTYQGRLRNNGLPVNGSANLVVGLYDAATGGNLLGAQTLTGVSVANGLFTVLLNANNELGAGAFSGAPRWLDITVNGTELTPRQPLTSTPYAQTTTRLSLPYNDTFSLPGHAFNLTNTQGSYAALHGNATGSLGQGVFGEAATGYGVYGYGLTGVAGTSGAGTGVYGYSVSGAGVYAYSDFSEALHAVLYTGSGVNISNYSIPAILGESSYGNGVMGVVSTPGAGVFGIAPNGYGVLAISANGYPIYAYDTPSGVDYSMFAKPAILGESLSRNGVLGVAAATNTSGIIGYNPAGYGVTAVSTTGTASYSTCTSGTAVYSTSSTGTGLFSYSGSGYAMHAMLSNSSGVNISNYSVPALLAESNYGNGIIGVVSTTGAGVLGYAPTGTGLLGVTDSGNAVYALSNATSGVVRTILAQNTSDQGAAILGWASATSGNNYGVVGQSDSPAGWAVFGFGDVGCTGVKSFVIDHPLDPANKILRHYCTEGPEPQNAYNGVVTTDAQGFATVQLPDYFDQINRDFRYQLTVIDSTEDFVLAKVAQEIANNQFRVRTSQPNTKVSWEVKGVRNDPWVRAHGIQAEQDKPAAERGTYLQPELYGQPREKGSAYSPAPQQPATSQPAPAPLEPASTPFTAAIAR